MFDGRKSRQMRAVIRGITSEPTSRSAGSEPGPRRASSSFPTTLAGLLLAGGAVAFNTLYYPIDFQPVAAPAELAQGAPSPPPPSPEQAAPPAAAESKEPAAPPSPARDEVKPVPDVAAKPVDTVPDKPAAEDAPPADEKPMVPVVRVVPAGARDPAGDPASTIRRLPPVDRAPPPPASAPPSPGNVAIPIYPSTGIE
jgi:hypothetical protein